MRLQFRGALLALLLFAGAASAQETRATLTGHIADASGAAVPEAKITVTNEDTGVKTDSTSTDDGVYTVPFLQPGRYSIAVGAPGFSQYLRQGVRLQTGDHLGVDVSLTVGAVNTEVKVTADAR